MSIAEQATRSVRRGPQREVRQPSHLVFAKVNGGWFKLGAAWESDFRNGGSGYSLQLSVLPLAGWDGRMILALPDAGEPTDE